MSADAAAQLRRLLILLPQLADGREHLVDDIAARLGVDAEDVMRDLRALAARTDLPGGHIEGAVITIDARKVSATAQLFERPMRLSPSELAALELGLAMLHAERPPDEHAVLEAARARLREARSHVATEGEPARTAAAADTLDAARRELRMRLQRAADLRQRVHIRYRKREASDGEDREVCPYVLINTSGQWYLVAHCERSAGLRVFRVDRIESVTQGEGGFELDEDFDVRRVLREDKALMVHEELPAVTIRYSARIARWIAERERAEPDADGSLTLAHPLADEEWAVRHVLQYGPDAEVLDPPAVRAQVRERLRQMLA